MEYDLKMTVSIWSSLISIWDILLLYVAPWVWAMRVPALIRYVAAEPGNLLSPSWDGPKMYFNIEAGRENVSP
jgi:hypothetical protein